jgi:hypothetical protein
MLHALAGIVLKLAFQREHAKISKLRLDARLMGEYCYTKVISDHGWCLRFRLEGFKTSVDKHGHQRTQCNAL